MLQRYEMDLEGGKPTMEESHDGPYVLWNDLLPMLREALDWSGLKVTNEKLQWALRELGPTGNTAEAYIVAMVEHGMYMRKKAQALLDQIDATKGVEG